MKSIDIIEYLNSLNGMKIDLLDVEIRRLLIGGLIDLFSINLGLRCYIVYIKKLNLNYSITFVY